MPSMMNINLLRQPYENTNVMLMFYKHSTPVQIIFKTRRDVTLIFTCYQACCSQALKRSPLQSAAVVEEITDCALN